MTNPIPLQQLPAVELHLHLEGCATPATLRELLRRRGRNAPEDLNKVKQCSQIAGMRDFLGAWQFMCSLVEEAEDYALFAEALCDYMDEQRLLYAEVFYSPDYYVMHKGFDLERIHAAIEEVLYRRGVHVSIICDFVRNQGVEQAEHFYDKHLKPTQWKLLRAIGIGGVEQHTGASGFCRLYDRARDSELGLTAHAGEWMGPESIRSAVEDLGVTRIGHGTTAIKDPDLMQLLREKNICVDMCPGSNLLTGSITSARHHPLASFHNSGICVTLNSDDPGFFRTSLKQEMQQAMEIHGLGLSRILDMQLNAVNACFLQRSRKQDLKNRLYRSWQSVIDQ